MVWETFINKLEVERPSIQVKYAVKEYLRSEEIEKFEMNGREIRNGMHAFLYGRVFGCRTDLGGSLQHSKARSHWPNMPQNEAKATRSC
jgi:hypothetical protein